MVMEFLDGVTLKHRIAGRPLEPDLVLDLGISLADAAPTRLTTIRNSVVIPI
jgi:hypothetical protein